MAKLTQSEILNTEEVVESKDAQTKAIKENTQPKRRFLDDDEIECKSICYGKTNFLGKSGQLYVFLAYGDTERVKYKDLKAANSAKSSYIYKPMILIQDKDVTDEFRLTKLYNQILSFNSPEDFFNLTPDKMREKLNIMPEGMKETIKNTATKLIQENELDSISKIKVLDEILGTEFISFM